MYLPDDFERVPTVGVDNTVNGDRIRAGEGAAPGCKAASRLCAGEDQACGGAGADWLSGGCLADCQPAAAADVVVAGSAAGNGGLDGILASHATWPRCRAAWANGSGNHRTRLPADGVVCRRGGGGQRAAKRCELASRPVRSVDGSVLTANADPRCC